MTNYEKLNLIISAVAAFSTALAIIWILFKETILARWRAPKLESRIFMEMPYVTQYAKTYYYHLGVKNNGRSTALGCRGYVDAIYEYKNGDYERIKNFITMPIYWVREDRIDTFIVPGQEKFLDFGTIETQVHYVGLGDKRPFVPAFREFSDTSWLYPGKYEIKVILYSENSKILSVDLHISWSGQAKEKYEEMLKELVIKENNKIVENCRRCT